MTAGVEELVASTGVVEGVGEDEEVDDGTTAVWEGEGAGEVEEDGVIVGVGDEVGERGGVEEGVGVGEGEREGGGSTYMHTPVPWIAWQEA